MELYKRNGYSSDVSMASVVGFMIELYLKYEMSFLTYSRLYIGYHIMSYHQLRGSAS